MNNQNMNSAITRRHFARTLALPAGALLLGSALPAWAKKKKPQETPPAPAPADPIRPKFETKVLWDFDGLMKTPLNNCIQPKGHNGNVYLVVYMAGLSPNVVKIPLDGSKVQMAPLEPGFAVGGKGDPHRYFVIDCDTAGYIHVVGDMHSSPPVKHWISTKPEDISAFVRTEGADNPHKPHGKGVTYPAFSSSPDGVLYLAIRSSVPAYSHTISVLDVKTQTWSVLGAEVSKADLIAVPSPKGGKHAHEAKGSPVTLWEANGEGGYFAYTQPHAKLNWDKNKRMHIVCAVLGVNTPSSQGRHTHSHVLYAYSDDGGKTIHRGDGSKIEWPMRVAAGPHQGNIVYAEHEGNPPWLHVSAGIGFDAKNRPVVGFASYKTGPHKFVLEKGKWTELKSESSKAGVASTTEEEEEKSDPLQPKVPDDAKRPDMEYFRKTGNLIYKTIRKNPDDTNKIKIMLGKVVPAKP